MVDPSLTHTDREHELLILYEIASISKHVHNSAQVVDLSLDKATRLLGAEMALLYLYDPEDHHLHARAARGVRLAKIVPRIKPEGDGLDLARQDFTWLEAQPTGPAIDPLGGVYPVHAALGLPVRHDAQLLGWLYVARLRRDSFETYEVGFYRLLVDQVASALAIALAWDHNRKQQDALVEANQRLEQLLGEVTATSQRQEQLLQTIRSLSAPTLTIDEHILLIPLIGQIDVERSDLIKQRMLTAISSAHAQVAILDVTGIVAVDECVIQTLLEAAQAAQLLGAQVILCGITPEVAQVIVALGIELRMPTMHNLHAAIELARKLGRR